MPKAGDSAERMDEGSAGRKELPRVGPLAAHSVDEAVDKSGDEMEIERVESTAAMLVQSEALSTAAESVASMVAESAG